MNVYDYKIRRIPRRRTLSISISADNQIEVRVNKSISEIEIKDFLRKKERWIHKTLHFNKYIRKPYTPKKFIPGEEFLYLGNSYSLFCCERIKKNREIVKMQPGEMVLFLPPNRLYDQKYIRDVLAKWYKHSAQRIISERAFLFSRQLNVEIKSLQIKTLKRSWGNCSFSGKISFSWRLVMCSLTIIDYVIVHELCHILHHNHSPSFWKVLARIIPEFQDSKKWLIINENLVRW